MLYMVTFTINISPMLAYIPYMDPMGIAVQLKNSCAGPHLPSHALCRAAARTWWLHGTMGGQQVTTG